MRRHVAHDHRTLCGRSVTPQSVSDDGNHLVGDVEMEMGHLTDCQSCRRSLDATARAAKRAYDRKYPPLVIGPTTQIDGLDVLPSDMRASLHRQTMRIK